MVPSCIGAALPPHQHNMSAFAPAFCLENPFRFVISSAYGVETPRAWMASKVGNHRLAILNRDGWRCVTCGKPGRLEVDHVQPIPKGGAPWDQENLQSLCRPHHFAKTAEENKRPPKPERQGWAELVEELS